MKLESYTGHTVTEMSHPSLTWDQCLPGIKFRAYRLDELQNTDPESRHQSAHT